MVARTHGDDGWRRRTVSQNWDGDDEDQMVDNGVIEMTVRVFYGFGEEDPWREVDGWRRRHVREV